MEELEGVINRLKEHFGVNENKELAEKMGINVNTFNTWVKRKSIPFDKLHNVTIRENISFDWVVSGKGNKYINEVKNHNSINFNNNSGKIKGVIGHNNGTVNINVNKIKDNKEAMDIIELLQYADDEILHKIKTNLTKLKEARELF